MGGLAAVDHDQPDVWTMPGHPIDDAGLNVKLKAVLAETNPGHLAGAWLPYGQMVMAAARASSDPAWAIDHHDPLVRRVSGFVRFLATFYSSCGRSSCVVLAKDASRAIGAPQYAIVGILKQLAAMGVIRSIPPGPGCFSPTWEWIGEVGRSGTPVRATA
ncbi:hypothetical protein OJF2_14030 [Aquisphaera giovannonii]|uniref:Uncharacterized protein n=1 Tax=Aquisphaera giovannonii TaxID=406548 RepID=A0A5B9VXC3_9BACT|nr:hypothetical protein [Aquisphaera giovannonii]QEH32918.1 hypothetical protein OJF2_14030 [Aquisphaera giovannonii]